MSGRAPQHADSTAAAGPGEPGEPGGGGGGGGGGGDCKLANRLPTGEGR